MDAQRHEPATPPPARDLGRFSRRFAAGQDIVRQGDAASSMFVLTEGRAEIVRLCAGAETVLTTLEPGDSFGEIALVETGARTATVRATASPTCVVEIDEARFVYLVSQQPAFALAVMRSLARRLAGHEAAEAVR